MSQSYAPGGTVTYVISLVNGTDAPVTGVTVTDDLGGYTFGDGTVYPLVYKENSLRLFADGALQPAPAVTAGPPMEVSGLDIPAGGSALLIYEAKATAFAPLGPDAEIVNTAVIAGSFEPVTVTAALPMAAEPELSIRKALSPETAAPGDTLTYTFVITNTGSQAADAAEAVAVTDTFDPILSGLSVTLDGAALSAPADYAYSESTGVFSTTQSRITVPAASYTQNTDGSWSAAPGETVLTVAGTV